MIKWIGFIFRVVPYVLIKYPELLYYHGNRATLSFVKRYQFIQDLIKHIMEGLHVDFHVSGLEKLKAEKLVQQLKAENHPVSLLFSTKRYRVSIASFATEKEANAALPRYKAITQRKDIWIYKTSSKEEI